MLIYILIRKNMTKRISCKTYKCEKYFESPLLAYTFT